MADSYVHGLRKSVPVTLDASGNSVGPGVTTVASGITSTQTTNAVGVVAPSFVQCSLTAAGGTATCDIDGTLDGTNWFPVGTLSMSGASDVQYAFVTDPWKALRVDVSAMSSATLTVIIGS